MRSHLNELEHDPGTLDDVASNRMTQTMENVI